MNSLGVAGNCTAYGAFRRSCRSAGFAWRQHSQQPELSAARLLHTFIELQSAHPVLGQAVGASQAHSQGFAGRPGLLPEFWQAGSPATVSQHSMNAVAGVAKPPMTPSAATARRRPAAVAGPPPRSCDTFVALPDSTADGSVVFGKNSDRETEVSRVAGLHRLHAAAAAALPCIF